MRRPPNIAAILTAGACALGLGAPAAAQTTPTPSSANAAGLRYLTWPGRTYRPATAAAEAPAPVSAARGRPPIIPHGGGPAAAAYAAAPTPGVPARQGLTPASAWIPSQAPAYAPQPAASVQTSASPPAAAAPTPTGYFAETAEAAPTPVAQAPAPVDAPAADPMAPRRDAPIFRLQRPAAAPDVAPAATAHAQAPVQAPVQGGAQPAPAAPTAQGGARYYSVHRQNGRQPDATPLPAPVYLDALPVDLTSMPASADLAQPPAAPNLIRNANGRLQALPANEDPTLP